MKPSAETIYGNLGSPTSLQTFPYNNNYSDNTYTEESLPQADSISRQGVSSRQRKNPTTHKARRGRKDKHGAAGTLTYSSSFTSSQSGSQYSGEMCASRVSASRPLSMGEEAFAAYSGNGNMNFYHHPNSSMHPPPSHHHFAQPTQNGLGFTQHASQQHPRITSTSTPYNQKSQMPNYGIFGDMDSDTDADISSSTNTASLQSPRATTQMSQAQLQKLRHHHNKHHHHHQVSHPSLRELRSQSCMDMTGSLNSPTQDHINAALARSLTFKSSCQTLPSHSEMSENAEYEPSWAAGEDSETNSVATTQTSTLDNSQHRVDIHGIFLYVIFLESKNQVLSTTALDKYRLLAAEVVFVFGKN